MLSDEGLVDYPPISLQKFKHVMYNDNDKDIIFFTKEAALLLRECVETLSRVVQGNKVVGLIHWAAL